MNVVSSDGTYINERHVSILVDIMTTNGNLPDNIDILLTNSDVLSLHVHVTDETKDMIGHKLFLKMKTDVLIVNTSRGDIVNELDLVAFLKKNPCARIATDVLADEVRNRLESPLLKYAQNNEQVTIPPIINKVHL